MSEYFYIVSQLNNLVIGEVNHEKDGGPLDIRSAGGFPSQLWQWDKNCRLINKLKYAMDVGGDTTSCEKHAVSRPPSEALSQRWHVQENMIINNANNFALEIPYNDEGDKDTTLLLSSILRTDDFVFVDIPSEAKTGETLHDTHAPKDGDTGKSESYDDNLSQSFLLVPEDAFEEFLLVQSDPDPLSLVKFWKSVADKYLHVLLGYSVPDYEKAVQNCIETLMECVETLDTVSTNVGYTQTVGGGAVIVGSGMTLAGLLLAPFVGGMSLALTVGGTATGAAGAVASVGGTLVNQSWEKSEQKKIQEAVAPAIRATFGLQSFLKLYVGMIVDAVEFLKTERGKRFAQDAFHITKMAEEEGQVAWNSYKLGNSLLSRAEQVEKAKAVKAMVDFIQADWYALHGANLGLAINVAAPGISVPVVGKTLIAAGTTSARMLAGAFSVVGVAFGFWDMLEGADRIKSGSDIAADFKLSAEKLEKESHKLLKVYQELQQ